MASKDNGVSAFEQGNLAGKDQAAPPSENPFPDGSAEHNNYEVGRRFGASNAVTRLRPGATALVPDADEEEN